MDTTTSVLESQLDWLTVTAKPAHWRLELKDVARDAIVDEVDRGNILRDWVWHGYDGEHAGHATWGERDDSLIAQFSGSLADSYFDRAYPVASRVTRIDLQVTWTDPEPSRDWASLYYDREMCCGASEGRSPNQTLIISSGGGRTYYSGSRSSDRFGRCYLKSAQAEASYPPATWRWEVEMKGDAADAYARELAFATDPHRLIAGWVHNFWCSRGCMPPWPMEEFAPLRIYRPGDNDVRRLLNWLQTQVSPTVLRLREKGYLALVVGSLGLLDALDPSFLPSEDRDGDSHRVP